MSRQRSELSGLAQLLVVVASLPLVMPSAGQAAVPQDALYDIIIRGSTGLTPFVRSGALRITPTAVGATTNGVNLVDVCIASGDPLAFPEGGSVWQFTNGACIDPVNGVRDLTLVSAVASEGRVVIKPDPKIGSAGINRFTDEPGSASAWTIVGGSVRLTFLRTDEVEGSMSLLGTREVRHRSERRYRATLKGRLRKDVPAPGPALGFLPNSIEERSRSYGISGWRPQGSVLNRRPRITVRVTRSSGGLSKAAIDLELDGRSIRRFRYSEKTGKLTFSPRKALRLGRHAVTVRTAGVAKTWRFRVVRTQLRRRKAVRYRCGDERDCYTKCRRHHPPRECKPRRTGAGSSRVMKARN
jgi:hypothetical protein